MKKLVKLCLSMTLAGLFAIQLFISSYADGQVAVASSSVSSTLVIFESSADKELATNIQGKLCDDGCFVITSDGTLDFVDASYTALSTEEQANHRQQALNKLGSAGFSSTALARIESAFKNKGATEAELLPSLYANTKADLFMAMKWNSAEAETSEPSYAAYGGLCTFEDHHDRIKIGSLIETGTTANLCPDACFIVSRNGVAFDAIRYSKLSEEEKASHRQQALKSLGSLGLSEEAIAAIDKGFSDSRIATDEEILSLLYNSAEAETSGVTEVTPSSDSKFFLSIIACLCSIILILALALVIVILRGRKK